MINNGERSKYYVEHNHPAIIDSGTQAADTEDSSFDLQIRIAEIDAEFKAMLQAVASDTLDSFDDEKAGYLMKEKSCLQQ